MRYEDDIFELSTGNTFYANCGILGIANDLGITQGYDGDVCNDIEFTEAERREIADYMIDLWQKWAAIKPAPKEE